jgi:predicted nucleic acid-binding protein
MIRVLLDRNVASYLLGGSAVADRYWRHLERRRLSLTLISVAEMRYGARIASWGRERWSQLEAFTAGCTLIPGNAEIASVAAEVMAYRKKVGRRMEWPDAWIAATAITHDLPLATHDADFFGIDGLNVITELTQVREAVMNSNCGWPQASATEGLVSYFRVLRSIRTTA